MALNYYTAYNAVRTEHPKASYYEDYDAILDFSFDNASNVVYDEVEYEQTYGENDFKTIGRVRVDTILDFNTGIILGDDYKMLLFPPEFKVEPYYGMKFRWKGSYWLVINTNSYGSLQNTAEIRRCNNVLRFFGKKGGKQTKNPLLFGKNTQRGQKKHKNNNNLHSKGRSKRNIIFYYTICIHVKT